MAEDVGHAGFVGLGYSVNGNGSNPKSGSGTSRLSSSSAGILKNLMCGCFSHHNDNSAQQGPDTGEEERPSADRTCEDNKKTGLRGIVIIPNMDSRLRRSQNIQQGIVEGRARANAILEKFQLLNRVHGLSDSSDSETASVYRERREIFLEKENQRKKEFWMKNFEYVAIRDRERFHQQMTQLDEARLWENKVQEKYRQALDERGGKLIGGNKRNKLTEPAGIGSAKRRKAGKEKAKVGHHPAPANQPDSSVAVYLSGLPVDGPISESMLNTFFSPYGVIHKIHLYRNKTTGYLKGDALVVYQLGKWNARDQLLQSVCSQMNGAELPCGAILKVEPADLTSQLNTAPQGPHVAQDVAPTENRSEGRAEDTKSNEDTDSTGDLDDFFQSLS